MILGMFGSVLGKGSAEEKNGATDEGSLTAVMDSPAVAPAPAAARPSAVPASAAQAEGSKAEPKACPRCGSTEPWGISSWCPNCFYHPRMGQVVISTPLPDPEVRHLAPGHLPQAESYGAVLASIPVWVHVLWVGVAAVFVLSVQMTLKLPKVGYERAVWTLAQAGIGLVAAGVAHVMVFFKAVPVTDKYGPFDLFLKPLDFWRYAISKMPSGAWRLWMVAWGVTATLSALVLIGGIRYSSIFETKSKGKRSTWYETSQVEPAARRAILSANS